MNLLNFNLSSWIMQALLLIFRDGKIYMFLSQAIFFSKSEEFIFL